MKRTALFLLMIALCATLCACGKEAAEEPGQTIAPEIETPTIEELPEEIVVDAPASYDPVVPVELSTFTTEISDVRRAALGQYNKYQMIWELFDLKLFQGHRHLELLWLYHVLYHLVILFV